MSRRPFCMVCLAFVIIIYLSTRLAGTEGSLYREWEGKTVSITGRVYQKETLRQTFGDVDVVYLRPLQAEELLPKENLICYLKAGQSQPRLGSIIRIKGKVKNFENASNPGQFDAKSYYQILKISFRLNQAEIQQTSTEYSKWKEKLYQIRKKLSGILEETLGEEEASVMKAVLLGEKSSLDKEIKSLYQRNGISHILAISGLHISLLGMGFYRLLRKTGMPVGAAAALAGGFMLLYGLMTGFSVSSLRAVIMFFLQLLASVLKRTYDMITGAFLAAVLLLLWQPQYLYYSGFLFSFGCILAIALFVPAMATRKEEKKEGRERKLLSGKGGFTYYQKGCEKRTLPLPLRLLLSSLSITLAILPLQLYFFYQLPLYSAVLNLCTIPLMSFLAWGGICLLAAGGITGTGGLPALLVTGILSIYEAICQLCDRLPGHLLTPGQPDTWQMLAYLSLLTVLYLFRKKLSLCVKWLILFCGVFLFFLPQNGKMEITFLDVGQGDGIHIQSAEGRHYLIDAGSSSVNGVGKYRLLPYLKAKGADTIEAVFITHPDKDHCSGVLELLEGGAEEGITVKRLILPDIAEKSEEAYRELEEAAGEAGITPDYISRGQVWKEGALSLHCMHPERKGAYGEANEYSTVLFLEYGSFTALLTGDIEGRGEEALLSFLKEEALLWEEEKGITLLKAAHHGSAYSTPEELLQLAKPAYTVISCGKNNSYGHPHGELLNRLEESKTTVCITYDTGAITFLTDGKRLSVIEFLENFQP